MLKVGITGGIGSGKSMVSRILSAMGYPVFFSDLESRKIVNTHPLVKTELTRLFGDGLYRSGELDRAMLAGIIFRNNQAREQVNAIIHPLVREAFTGFAAAQKSPLVFNEAAILFETGAASALDRMVLVVAPEALRIQRVVQRDGVDENSVRDRINQQWSDERKRNLADFVIENDEHHHLLEQVERVVDQLLIYSTSS